MYKVRGSINHLRPPGGALSGARTLSGWSLELDEVIHMALVAHVRVVVLRGGKGNVRTQYR